MSHQVALPPEIVSRVIRRRGRLHIHEAFEAARTALLVIDMQGMFLAPEQVGHVPMAEAVVPAINRAAAALRRAGGTVVWVITTFTAQTAREWSVFFDNFYTPERRARALEALSPGGSGHALWPEMDRWPGDWLVEKTRFSAMLPGASDLEARLADAGIDHLWIAGTLTSVCCESTARDAMMRNFKVTMLADANATHSDAEHNASLAALFQVFADVMTVDEALHRLRPAAA